MPTTQIATESARPSLNQNIEALYSSMHAGGAYDAKDQLITNGTHNELVDGFQEKTHTVKGFKTKMPEQQTEFLMGKNNTVVTTRMRTSVYGDLSTQKYWKM